MTQCDEREPGCGQCEKRQQLCPGYRNMMDLMFRDESSQVIKKAKAKAHRRVVNEEGSEDCSSPASDTGPSQLSISPRRGRGSLPLSSPDAPGARSDGVVAHWSYDDSSLLPDI